MPPPPPPMAVRLAADLRPSTDGSADRTWLSWRQPACFCLGQLRHGTDRRTDLGIAYGGGHKNSNNDCVAVAAIDVKKLRFLFWSRFYVFNVFFNFPNVFFIEKKTLAKFRAASRLTRSTFKITATNDLKSSL